MVIRISSVLFKSKSDQRTATPLRHKKTSYIPKWYSIGILRQSFYFEHSKYHIKKALEVDTNYKSLGVRVVSYAPAAFKVFIEGLVVILKRTISWLKTGSSSSLLRFDSNGR